MTRRRSLGEGKSGNVEIFGEREDCRLGDRARSRVRQGMGARRAQVSTVGFKLKWSGNFILVTDQRVRTAADNGCARAKGADSHWQSVVGSKDGHVSDDRCQLRIGIPPLKSDTTRIA